MIEYDKNLYIQNEIIGKDYHAVSKNVTIGEDVTAIKPNGPVIIESGTTTINADNVIIEDGFEVKIGASLEINP